MIVRHLSLIDNETFDSETFESKRNGEKFESKPNIH